MLKEIGRELKVLRVRNALTIKEVEGLTGIKSQTISNYELGKTNITLNQLARLLEAYKENLYIFFNRLYEYSHLGKR